MGEERDRSATLQSSVAMEVDAAIEDVQRVEDARDREVSRDLSVSSALAAAASALAAVAGGVAVGAIGEALAPAIVSAAGAGAILTAARVLASRRRSSRHRMGAGPPELIAALERNVEAVRASITKAQLGSAIDAAYVAANPPPLPFYPDAVTAVADSQLLYGFDLRDRAIQIARRDGANVVLRKHVSRAVDELTTAKRQRWAAPLGSLGGILVGAGLSGLVSTFTAGQPPTWSAVILTTALLVIGAVALSVSLLMTFVER